MENYWKPGDLSGLAREEGARQVMPAFVSPSLCLPCFFFCMGQSEPSLIHHLLPGPAVADEHPLLCKAAVLCH